MKTENKSYLSILDDYLNLYYADIKKTWKLNRKQYKKFCQNSSAKLDPKDYEIIKNRTLDEYFDKYYKSFAKGKVLVHSRDELFLLKKKRKYWEIPNKTEVLYFETPPLKIE